MRGLRDRGLISGQKSRDFSPLQNDQTGYSAQLAFYPKVTEGASPGFKAAGEWRWQLTPSCTAGKNGSRLYTQFPCGFTAWTPLSYCFPLDNWHLYVMSPQRRYMTSSYCLLLNVKPKKGFDFVLYSTNTCIYSKKNLLAGLSVTKIYGHTTFLNLRKGWYTTYIRVFLKCREVLFVLMYFVKKYTYNLI